MEERPHVSILSDLLTAQLAEIRDNQLTDDNIESLLLTCGDSMLLAALDLVDSKEGTHGLEDVQEFSH